MNKIKRLKLGVMVLTILAFFGLLSPATAVTSVKTDNWAGYKVKFPASSGQKVDSVSASWIVPTVQPSDELRQVSEWIGIGYTNSDLVQIGTLQTSVRGQVSYDAWYQRLPEDAANVLITALDGQVGPGTTINAMVEKIDEDTWLLTITAGYSKYQKRVNHLGSLQLSAEWVLELPTLRLRSRRTNSLADFGNVTFTQARATVNGASSIVGDLPYTVDEMVDPSYLSVIARTSALLEDGESFVVTYSASEVNAGVFITPRLQYIGLALIILAGTISTAAAYEKRVRRREERDEE